MKPIYLHYQPYGTIKKYEVCFYSGFPKHLPRNIIPHYSHMLVIYDKTLPNCYINSIRSLLTPYSKKIKTFAFQYGPKSLTSLTTIWETMVDFIPDVLVGIGGGTVTDLVGFASATYQRGIPDILFPTTTLGVVDAALGGKTAIDFHNVKNSIGTMHYPLAVFNIIETIKTLPKEEFVSGFSEAVKGAVLFDKKYFEELEHNVKNILTFTHSDKICKLMAQAAKLKMVNSEATSEHKIKLLYGHAIGHAIEIMSNERFRHGDAVSIGITIEGAIACILKYWNKKEWQRQTILLKKLSLPVQFPDSLDINTVFAAMSRYKKLVRDGAYGFIFPRKIGAVLKQKSGYITYIPIPKVKQLLQQAILFIQNDVLLKEVA